MNVGRLRHIRTNFQKLLVPPIKRPLEMKTLGFILPPLGFYYPCLDWNRRPAIQEWRPSSLVLNLSVSVSIIIAAGWP